MAYSETILSKRHEFHADFHAKPIDPVDSADFLFKVWQQPRADSPLFENHSLLSPEVWWVRHSNQRDQRCELDWAALLLSGLRSGALGRDSETESWHPHPDQLQLSLGSLQVPHQEGGESLQQQFQPEQAEGGEQDHQEWVSQDLGERHQTYLQSHD